MKLKFFVGLLALCATLAWSSQSFATCAVMCSVTPIEQDCTPPELLNDMCNGDPNCAQSDFAKNWAWSTDNTLQVQVSCETVCCAPGQCSDPTPTDPDAAQLFIDRDGAAIAGTFSSIESMCEGNIYTFDQSLAEGQYTLRYESELFGKVIVQRPVVEESSSDEEGGCQHTSGSADGGAVWLMMFGVGLLWRRRKTYSSS